MRLGLLATSWPSPRRPYVGHFISDLGAELLSRGHALSVCVPHWEDEPPCPLPGARMYAGKIATPSVAVGPSPFHWPLVLGALSRAAKRASEQGQRDLWLAHWWPTGLAVPQGERAIAVLHGSDVDLAERMPSALVQGLVAHLDGTISVAEHLEGRFSPIAGLPSLGVAPLGAQDPCDEGFPDAFEAWASDPRPKVISVARDVAGKGIEVARRASARLPELTWAIVTPELGLGPSGIRALLRYADLCVIPSEIGSGLPSEGRPHILTQALVAGVGLVGGPSLAVRHAVRSAGQVEISEAGVEPLCRGIRSALGHALPSLRHSAASAGRELRWSVVIERWEALIRRAEPLPPQGGRS